jgi:hypothetical protein
LAARTVADSVAAPQAPRVELRPPTLEEVARMLMLADHANDPFRALWTVAFYISGRWLVI